jgi:hypothetical protein
MGFVVHISQLHQWGGRLGDTGAELAAAVPGLAASPPGWATAAALSAWESALLTLLQALGAQADHTGAALRACAANYAEADRPLSVRREVLS